MAELAIDIGFGRLAAKSWGEPAGRDPPKPRLLALHGWLDNAASFDGLAPLLAPYHVVALDFAGHGRSAHRASGHWYHHVDHLSDVLEAAQVLGWSSFSLLGHSMGAGIASMLAAAVPERIERLLLIEGLGPPTAEAEQSLPQLSRALAERGRIEDKALRVFAHPDEAIRARQQANGLSREAAERLVERGIVAVDGGYRWSSDPRLTLASPLRYSEPQILALLRGIRAPTVLLLAEPSMPYFAPAVIEARIAAVEGIRVVHLSGTHHLHMEQPERVAAVFR